MSDPQGDALWWFNEATGLLGEARSYLPEATGLAEEVDDSLPKIRDALKSFADYLSATAVCRDEGTGAT